MCKLSLLFSQSFQLLDTLEAVTALSTSSSVRTTSVWTKAGCVMALMTVGTDLMSNSTYAVRSLLFIFMYIYIDR